MEFAFHLVICRLSLYQTQHWFFNYWSAESCTSDIVISVDSSTFLHARQLLLVILNSRSILFKYFLIIWIIQKFMLLITGIVNDCLQLVLYLCVRYIIYIYYIYNIGFSVIIITVVIIMIDQLRKTRIID